MWEIYAYHNTESLAGIFNAIAAIVASGTYLSAIAAVAFCGFVAALIAYMFSPEKLQGWKWIISVVLVYGVPVLKQVERTRRFKCRRNWPVRGSDSRDLRSGFKHDRPHVCPSCSDRIPVVRRRWHARNQPDQGERDRIGWQGLQQQPDGGRAEGGE